MAMRYAKVGGVWYGANHFGQYASMVIGCKVIVDEGEGAVAPKNGREYVEYYKAPLDVRTNLDPAYLSPDNWNEPVQAHADRA